MLSKSLNKLLLVFCIIFPVLLIVSPNFSYVIIFEDAVLTKAVGRLLYFTALFLIPIVFFYKNVRFYFYLISPLLLTSIFVNYLYIYIKAGISLQIFSLLLNTNKQESKEFLTNIPIYYAFLSLIAIVIYFLCIKKIPKILSFKSASIVTTGCLVVFFSFPLVRFGFHDYSNSLTESTIHFYPFNIYKRGKDALIIRKSLDDFNIKTKNFSFNAHKKTIAGKEIYILVIGETSRRDHWGIYGYNRNTSPLMKERNLIIYSDAISSGFCTNFAVPIMLTRATATNFLLHTKEKGVVHAFKEAAFATYWINAQYGGGDIDIHAKEADNYLTTTIKYEEELPPILSDLLRKEKKDKIFIIFHTSGSHWRYDLRYPDAFNVFKPSIKDEFAVSTDMSKRDVLINSYDNSILYTDFVLNKLINVLDSQKVISSLVFISDHGENLLDDERGFSSHAQATKYTAEIPLFIWTSDSYKKTYPKKIEFLNQNKDCQVSTENIFYSMLNLADITIKDGYSFKSFADSSFKEAKERFIITESVIKSYNDIKKKHHSY
jgi:glucan phosphoethanolaminetransferase (alkaline phosphatase superfamily)